MANALEVYCASASQIPWTLQKIGRLCEQTFRAAGEGTGRSADLGLFDDYYEHLFIWHSENREIVGAYRLGQSDTIRKRFGARGRYLSSLFEFREPFFNAARSGARARPPIRTIRISALLRATPAVVEGHQ